MRIRSLLIATTLFGCGGPGSFSGTVAGNGIAVQDAIFAVAKDGSGKVFAAELFLGDKPGICATLKANRNPKSSAYLQLTFESLGSTGAVSPDVGDYTVKSGLQLAAGNWAYGVYAKTDPNCQNTLTSSAAQTQSGTVKVASIKPEANGQMIGTFDITFGPQKDKVTGAFSATFCDWDPFKPPTSCE